MSAFETAWGVLKELTPTQLRHAAYGIDPTLGRVGHATKKPDRGEMTSRHIMSGHLGEAMQPRGVFDPETSESFDINPISQSKRVLGYGSDYDSSVGADADKWPYTPNTYPYKERPEDQDHTTAEMDDPHEMQPRMGRTGGKLTHGHERERPLFGGPPTSRFPKLDEPTPYVDLHSAEVPIGYDEEGPEPEPERGWSPQDIGDYLRVARKQPPPTTESQKTRGLSRDEIELLGRQAAMRRR